MNRKKLLNFHETFAYTYYIKIATKCENCDVEEIFQKFKNYAYNHDSNSHLKSVKEYNENSHVLHYYILYFTNKKLIYSRVHKRIDKKMSPNTIIHIQLIPKTKEDIENIIKFMKKIKNDNKSKLLSNRNNSELKVIPKLTLFDSKTDSKIKEI